MNWGEAFFDHYQKVLGRSKTQAMFRSNAGGPRVQVLGFEGVFAGGARVYCTLGLTHFSEAVGGPAELLLGVDEAFEAAQVALANACFFAAENRIRVGVGTVIGGVQTVSPELTTRWGKSALYVTSPFNLPAGAGDVPCGGEIGKLHMAVLISQSEYEFARRKGASEFEGRMEAAKVDPIHIARQSAC